MAKRPTQADIARRTGLSVASVSLALNSPEGSRIPEATARRVREAAAELGYVADSRARSLRTGRTRTIGLISDEVTVTRFAAAMIRGFLDAAEARDHAVMIAEVGDSAEGLARGLRTMRAHRIDGIALGLMDSRRIPPLPSDGGARVILNGLSGVCPAVLPDEHPAGRAAVRHLLEHGHRRIALIGRHEVRPEEAISVNIGVRMDGIDAAMTEAGLRFADEHRGDVWEPDLGYAGAHAVMERTPDLTAILAANDRIGFGVTQALLERGLRIPDNISVMSFDDEVLATLARPPLSTMRLPYREMGAAGADLLLDLVEGSAAPPNEPLHLPLDLVQRGSVASA